MRTTKLSEYGTFRNGLNFSKEESRGTGCKILGVGDFGNNVFIPVDSLSEINAALVTDDDLIQNGDILFVRSNGNKALVGRMLLAKDIAEPICYSGFCIRFRPHNSANSAALFYALKSPYCKKQYTPTQQTNITNLSQDKLGNVQIPEFIIQTEYLEAIGLLSKIDAKIDLNNRLCDELESAMRTLYDYWFVQFDFPDEHSAPFHSSGGKMEWCPELSREVPNGWKPQKLGELLAPIPNTIRIQTGEYKKGGSIPIIDQSASFIAGYTDIKDAILSKKNGYIVFGDHTRIVKYIRFPFARGADGTQIIDSNSSCMPNELFYQMIRSIDLSNQGYARHYKFLKDTVVIVPSEEIAKKYQMLVGPLYDKIAKTVFENAELEKLRDWLLPMLMNGQAKMEEN